MDESGALAEIERLQSGHTNRRDEQAILEILRGLGASELDAVVCAVDLVRLFSDVDDRRVGPKNLSALLDLLSGERLVDLSVESRAEIVRALQRGRTCGRDEEAIRRVFLGTGGEALSRLKTAIEDTPDHRDLHQLLYADIDHPEVRDQIVAHIAAECGPLPVRGYKILSDIDDTVYCNWKDPRFPKKTVYPGVRTLYRALVQGPGDLVFISARPGDRIGVVERKTLDSLDRLGFDNAVMLAGSVLKVHSNRAIAEKKIRNLDEYRRLWPEYGMVFFGDSGQGDAALAEHLLAEPGPHGAHAFIHDVIAMGVQERSRLRGEGVAVFDSWVEAAHACREHGLLTDDQLRQVADDARVELTAIAFSDRASRSAREAELEAALAAISDAC